MADAAESLMGVETLKIDDDAELDRAFVDVTRSLPSRAPVSFTEPEQKLLDLHDQLEELRLERALLEAQQRVTEGSILDHSFEMLS
jgi:hypothetical protein